MRHLDPVETHPYEIADFVIGERVCGMGKHRGATRSMNEIDGSANVQHRLRDERRSSFRKVCSERFRNIGNDACIDHGTCDVRAAGHPILYLLENCVETDRMPESLQPSRHIDQALSSDFVRLSPMFLQCMMIWVEPVPKHMDLAHIVSRAEFDTGDEVDAQCQRRFSSLSDAIRRVVVGEGRSLNPMLSQQVHEGRRIEHAVGSGRMKMEVSDEGHRPYLIDKAGINDFIIDMFAWPVARSTPRFEEPRRRGIIRVPIPINNTSTMRELVMVGDRVLIAPDEGDRQTRAGLYLPATVAEKEKIHSGRVVKIGPGYVIPNPEFSGEPWAAQKEAVRYLPLQAQTGDHAFFLRKEGLEVQFEGEEYIIVPHAAILALVREREEVRGDLGIDDLL